MGTGRVMALTRDNKVRWEIAGLKGPNDVQILANDHILVAERNGAQVTERDRSGAILWKHECNNPIGCQRLPGGNTLITTFHQVMEVTPEGNVVFKYSHPPGFRQAKRMRNDVILFVTGDGEIGELGPDRKLARTITPKAFGTGATYWSTVETLPGGRFLAVYGGANKVVELDAKGCGCLGAHTGSAGGSRRAFAMATRSLPVLKARRSSKSTGRGKEVAKTVLEGRPFVARRY